MPLQFQNPTKMNKELHQMKMEFTNLKNYRPIVDWSIIKNFALFFIYYGVIVFSILLIIFSTPTLLNTFPYLNEQLGPEGNFPISSSAQFLLGILAFICYLLIRRIKQVMDRNIYISDMLDWINNKIEALEKTQQKKQK